MATLKEDRTQVESISPERSSNTSDLEDANDKNGQQGLDDDLEFSLREQRKIVHRIDRRLVVMTGVIYMVSLMDRSNLPNAAIAGMNVDLDLNVGFRYVGVTISVAIAGANGQHSPQ